VGAPRLLPYLQEHDAESSEHFARLCQYLMSCKSLTKSITTWCAASITTRAPRLNLCRATWARRAPFSAEVATMDWLKNWAGPPTPGIGFGCGIERLLLEREAVGALASAASPLTAFVVTLGDEARAAGVALLHELREAGIRCDSDFVGRSLKAQMREANRQAARYTLLLGSDELAQGVLALKDMATSTQETLPRQAVIERLLAEQK
jgi:histidyl-tRNA synthetase